MDGAPKSSLKLIARPEEFFYELVREAISGLRLKIQPETEFYLVHLLNRFITTDSLFPRDGEGQRREEPLALMVKDALDQTEAEAQRSIFRHVGDFSLYVAGYFQDSLNRRAVDVDYYIGMGGAAYHAVASREPDANKQRLYGELAQKFGRFVDVLATISEKTQPRTEKDLLRTYEVWVRTGSEKAARALQEAGIVPNDASRKTVQ